MSENEGYQPTSGVDAWLPPKGSGFPGFAGFRTWSPTQPYVVKIPLVLTRTGPNTFIVRAADGASLPAGLFEDGDAECPQ